MLSALSLAMVTACGQVIAQPQLPVQQVCKAVGITYPPKRIFIRAFKLEKSLEVWGANDRGKFFLLQSYPIAAASGEPGPKRKEGDFQVPEGAYKIAVFNPHSRFHLSLGLNYPNASDLVRSDAKQPGSDIYIHGNAVSVGCMAMTDPKIDEIYGLASCAEHEISVHVFPCRMDQPEFQELKKRYPQWTEFWSELQPIYDAFEKSHKVPAVKVLKSGAYRLAS